MSFYRRFPYTTLNDINLDWIIKKVKALIGVVDEKQDKPDTAGTAGQVLGLDENLNPAWLDQTGGGGGTTNYNNLTNKPQIEGVTLSGNKTAAELGLARASDVPTKTSDLTNDSGFVNASEAAAAAPVQSVNGLSGGDVHIAIPSASSALPQMDGVASAGTNFSQFARGDHVHPTDTSRQAALTAENPLGIGYGGTGQNGIITVATASEVATPGENITIVAVAFNQWGKVGALEINLRADADIESGATLATLVDGKRPARYLRVLDNTGGIVELTKSSAGGLITVRHSVRAGTTINVSATYLFI